MLKDTPQGQTNHCLMCEDAAKRIEELERQNAMLVEKAKDVIEILEQFKYESDEDSDSYSFFSGRINEDGFFIAKHSLENSINATSAQSSTWMKKKHVEWMKSLPVAGTVKADFMGCLSVEITSEGFELLERNDLLVAIPSDKD